MALGPIRQVSAEVHIAFNKLRIAHHYAGRGMSGEKPSQFFSDRAFLFTPVHQALVHNCADAHIAVLQLNPPSPPAIACEVVRCRAPNAEKSLFARIAADFGVEAIPVARVSPAAPGCECGVGFVGVQPAIGAGELGFDPRCIDHPAGFEGFCFGAGLHPHFLQSALFEPEIQDLGRSQQFNPGGSRAAQDLLIKLGAVDQEGGDGREIFSAEFRAFAGGAVGPLGKPEAEAVFGNLGSDEVVREAEHAGQEKSADLRGRLAHAALEGCVFLDHKDAESRIPPFQKKCGRGS